MWLKRWRRKKDYWKMDEQQAVLYELEEAKKDWIRAYQKLDHVVEKEQIDYAIFALEAAEKRYEMLLRKVKEQYASYVVAERDRPQANEPDQAYDEAVASKEDKK